MKQSKQCDERQVCGEEEYREYAGRQEHQWHQTALEEWVQVSVGGEVPDAFQWVQEGWTEVGTKEAANTTRFIVSALRHVGV